MIGKIIQPITANISKLGGSGLRKVSTFNQNCNGLIGGCTEIPAYSYWQTVICKAGILA